MARMNAVGRMAGLVLAGCLLAGVATGAAAQGPAAPATAPELDEQALARCLADHRESRRLLEQHHRQREAVAASGRAVDAARRELAALRDATDRYDATAVIRYNERAAEIDRQVERHNAEVAGLEASRRMQREVAARYNRECAGRRIPPAMLEPASKTDTPAPGSGGRTPRQPAAT